MNPSMDDAWNGSRKKALQQWNPIIAMQKPNALGQTTIIMMMITTITITNERHQAKRMQRVGEREENRFPNGKWCRCKFRRINHIYFTQLEIDNRCSVPVRDEFDGSIQANAVLCWGLNASRNGSNGMNDTTKPIVSARNVILCTHTHT